MTALQPMAPWFGWCLILMTPLVNVGSPPRVRAEQPGYPIRPVSFEKVHLSDTFWAPRIETNRQVTLPACFRRCEETGRIGNFEAAAERNPAGFRGIRFDDSDVFKVIEGAAYTLAIRYDRQLDEYLDRLIAKIAAAQESDGYLYTVKTSGADNPYAKAPRWSKLDHSHELYNIGHLYEAAVAHFRATGKRSLLEVAIRSANLVAREFGPGPTQRKDVPGHEEIEIGLVKLYRVTGNRRYLELAKFFVDQRGRREGRKRLYGTYAQDHEPITQQREAVGHAVRGGYFYAAVADIAAMTGDPSYRKPLDAIWHDVVETKMYLTGSVGQQGAGEGYAGPYRLPNLMAYNETCASIAMVLWNHRMFLLNGDAKYIDVLERSLYNGVLAGVSLKGDRFFYPNPLACDMVFPFNHGSFDRKPWFGTSCCPTNIVRTLPSVPGYLYAVTEDSLYVNLYASGTGECSVGETAVKVQQETDYPWSGQVTVTVTPQRETRWKLRLRIPGWARGHVLPSNLYRFADTNTSSWKLTVNGQPFETPLERGYAVIDRTWRAGDRVRLELPMTPRRVWADPKVEADRGRVAVVRGPMVYCVEGVDHGGRVRDLWLPDTAPLRAEYRPKQLGGITVVLAKGGRIVRTEKGNLKQRSTRLTMVPYEVWCHRGANEMAVWLPRSPDLVEPPPIPTIASKARPSASHCWVSDTVAALHDQRLPKRSSDQNLPRFTWWDHRGTTEWVQYDLAEPTEVDQVAVYWFDDTGVGRCRLPRHWSVQYRKDGRWVPVDVIESDPITADRFNRQRFRPVRTDALRIVVQLQEGFSGGILEWQVGAPGESKK